MFESCRGHQNNEIPQAWAKHSLARYSLKMIIDHFAGDESPSCAPMCACSSHAGGTKLYRKKQAWAKLSLARYSLKMIIDHFAGDKSPSLKPMCACSSHAGGTKICKKHKNASADVAAENDRLGHFLHAGGTKIYFPEPTPSRG
ncbi:MAG: hypothetical protein KGP29_03640 [Proteobacteria bacterium]|nr:hypothetical protein [Pseudomonadota bacterium]